MVECYHQIDTFISNNKGLRSFSKSLIISLGGSLLKVSGFRCDSHFLYRLCILDERGGRRILYKCLPWTGEMVQHWGVLVILLEDQSLVPSTHVGQLRTACDSSSRASNALSCFCRHLFACGAHKLT